jgi:hypothetical protein
VDDALGADALALAVEAKVEDVLVRMLSTLLSRRYPRCHSRRTVMIALSARIVVVTCWWPFVNLGVGPIVLRHPCSYPFEAIVLVHFLGFNVTLGRGGFGGDDELLQFSDALGVQRRAFVADLADDALPDIRVTLAVFFFFSSKERRSAAQSRQRSWLQASMRMS